MKDHSGTNSTNTVASLSKLCPVCGHSFSTGKRRGSPQKFCSGEHRHEFSSKARAWATCAYDLGLLSIDDLMAGEGSVRTFLKRLAGK